MTGVRICSEDVGHMTKNRQAHTCMIKSFKNLILNLEPNGQNVDPWMTNFFQKSQICSQEKKLGKLRFQVSVTGPFVLWFTKEQCFMLSFVCDGNFCPQFPHSRLPITLMRNRDQHQI